MVGATYGYRGYGTYLSLFHWLNFKRLLSFFILVVDIGFVLLLVLLSVGVINLNDMRDGTQIRSG
jgi:hypothetical protein